MEFVNFGKVRVSSIQVAFGFLCNGAILVGIRKIRFDLDCFGVIRDGSIQIAFGILRNAPIVVGIKKVRPKLDRFGESAMAPSLSPLDCLVLPRLQ